MPRSRSAPPPSSSGVQPVCGVGRDLLGVVGEDGADIAERAIREQLADPHHVRQVPGPHGLHGEQSPLGRDVAHPGGLGGVQGEGLLDEHVLAGLEGEDRVLGVQRMRRRDVDDVDVGVGDELFV